MKTLVIVESEEINRTLSQYLESNGFAVIHYRWLLKAMDNIEEASPDYVILCAQDFPRQWKTFLQYLTTYEKIKTIIVCTSSDLNEEDKKAADFLGVKTFIGNIENQSSMELLLEVLKTGKEGTGCLQSTEATSEESNAENGDEDCKIMISNPVSNKIIIGKATGFSGNKIDFVPKYAELFEGINEGDTIRNCTLKKCGSLSSVDLKVLSLNLETDGKIVFEIN